jgi:hypothetical protein
LHILFNSIGGILNLLIFGSRQNPGQVLQYVEDGRAQFAESPAKSCKMGEWIFLTVGRGKSLAEILPISEIF